MIGSGRSCGTRSRWVAPPVGRERDRRIDLGHRDVRSSRRTWVDRLLMIFRTVALTLLAVTGSPLLAIVHP
jgi:hypothetical protein